MSVGRVNRPKRPDPIPQVNSPLVPNPTFAYNVCLLESLYFQTISHGPYSNLMTKSGPLIIISAPSGTGKTTIVKRLLAVDALRLRLAVSATTRPKRDGEVDGTDYHFVTKEEFERRIAENGFLEWAQVHANLYGTPVDEVQKIRQDGDVPLLDIDVAGARQVREKCPEAKSIFLTTPSREELERRLRARKTESEEQIQIRLKNAQQEEQHAHEYTKQIVNDDLETTVAEMVQTVQTFLEAQNDA